MRWNPSWYSLIFAVALTALVARAAVQNDSEPVKFDVVVVGGSSGGISAALAAARMGVSVALIEDTPVLGGMLANGISNIDTFSYESLSGIFEEFRQNVVEHYKPVMDSDPVFAWTERLSRHMDGKSRQSNLPKVGGRWEPHVADKIFKRLASRLPNLHIYYNRHADGVLMSGSRIIGVVTEDQSGRRNSLLGEVIIDATHEADIAAWAGVPYRVGREARSPLEPHAGDILFFNDTGEIMKGSTGRQDGAVVSYGLRLTIKIYSEKDGNSHLLAAPPPGYNKEDYVNTGRGKWKEPGLPNNKEEMNANPVGNEMQEINWVWPEATRAERRRLYEIYRNHALGYLYFLQHERGLKHIGLPRDEFTDNGNVPYRVFVREARRIEGELTMTEADINPFVTGQGLIPPIRSESIAIGHYPIDSKMVRRKTDLSTPDKGQGDFFLVNVASAFQVPYGAIVPRNVDGLLVPVAMSATHVAFSAIRMEPTWTAMGQAAGVAAVLSIRHKTDARRLPVELLQRELIRQKCRLMFFWDVPLDHPAFAAIQWLIVRQGVSGSLDRRFRPDDPLARAEMAAFVVDTLKLWPSVSNAHFTDVPYTHPAFRAIETMFDNRLLEAFGVRPRWPEAGGYDGRGSFKQGKNDFGEFRPSEPVTWGELIAVLQKARGLPSSEDGLEWARKVLGASEFGRLLAGKVTGANASISRGEATALLAALSDPI